MIQALIISIIIGIVTNGIQGAINYFKSKKVKELEKDLIEEQIKLANEVRRSEEKRQQVESMLQFQSEDKPALPVSANTPAETSDKPPLPAE